MFTWAFYVVKKKPFDKGVLYTVWTVSEMGLHFDLLIMPTLSCQEYSEKQGTPEAYDRIIVDTWKGLGLLPILLPLLGIVPFLFKAKYYKGLQFPPIFSPSHTTLARTPFPKSKLQQTCWLGKERAIGNAFCVKEIDHISWEWAKGERTILVSHQNLRNPFW